MHDVVIIGAGIAGVACASRLSALGLQPKLIEAVDERAWVRQMAAARPMLALDPLSASLPPPELLCRTLPFKFGAAADRITRIAGPDLMVVWSRDEPVMTRRVVLAVGRTRSLLHVMSKAFGPSGMAGVIDLFACGQVGVQWCGPVAAYRHAVAVADAIADLAEAQAATGFDGSPSLTRPAAWTRA